MKIVIDIDEKDYKRYKDYPMCYPEGIFKIVGNGTPLPKNHGDLIDRTEVIKSLFDYHNGKKTIGQCIDDVPTIIEAESED